MHTLKPYIVYTEAIHCMCTVRENIQITFMISLVPRDQLYRDIHVQNSNCRVILVSRARRLKYVWSRLPRFCKRRRNVGDTNQIAERSIITKLLRVSHMTVSFSNEKKVLAKVAS